MVKKLLVCNYETSVFKLEGYTLTVIMKPEITKLIQRFLRKFET